MILGRGSNANIAAHSEPHAHVAGDAGEHGTHNEEDAAPDALRRGFCGEQEQHEEDHHGEDRERLELPVEVRRSTLLHRRRDLLHLRRAFARGQDLAHEHRSHHKGRKGDDGDDDHQGHIRAGQLNHGSPQGSARLQSAGVYAVPWGHAMGSRPLVRTRTVIWRTPGARPLPNPAIHRGE